MGPWHWAPSCTHSQCGHSRGKEVCLTLRVASGDGGRAICIVNLQVECSTQMCAYILYLKRGINGDFHLQQEVAPCTPSEDRGTVPLTLRWPCQWHCNPQPIDTISCMSCLNKDDMPCIQPIHIYQVLFWAHSRYWGFNIEHNRVYSLITEAGHNQLTKELKTKLQIVISATETHLFCSPVNLRPQRSVWQTCAWWIHEWREIEWNESVLWMQMLPIRCPGPPFPVFQCWSGLLTFLHASVTGQPFPIGPTPGLWKER